MKRLSTAPNIAIASLWADLLRDAGIEVSLQRFYAGGIAGEIPPDQALPELWLADDAQEAEARRLLAALRNPPARRWRCASCQEIVDGPFDCCWNCGTPAP